VFLVGADMQPEEGHVLLAEAVFLDQWRGRLGIDPRHLRFQPDDEPGQRLGKRLVCLHRAPGLQPERAGEKFALRLSIDDLVPAFAAGLGEIKQELGVAHRLITALTGDALLLGDVFEQERAHILVRAIAVDDGQPLGEMADVMVVLLDPFAEQSFVQPARHPGIAERVHRRMALRDRLFQGLPEHRYRHAALLPRIARTLSHRGDFGSLSRHKKLIGGTLAWNWAARPGCPAKLRWLHREHRSGWRIAHPPRRVPPLI
jgi:hypothetical protein